MRCRKSPFQMACLELELRRLGRSRFVCFENKSTFYEYPKPFILIFMLIQRDDLLFFEEK